MVFDALWILAKYVLLFVVAMIAYLVYKIVIKTYLFRRRYQRYPNVYVDKVFRPLMGDFYHYAEEVKNGRVFYHHAIEEAEVLKDYDMKVSSEGMFPGIKLISSEAMRQFTELQPAKIDRKRENRGIGKAMPKGFLHIRSDKKFVERKKQFLTFLSLNSASKYIPDMIRSIEDIASKWKEGESLDCGVDLNRLTFNIFNSLLFGSDIEHIISGTFKITSNSLYRRIQTSTLQK